MFPLLLCFHNWAQQVGLGPASIQMEQQAHCSQRVQPICHPPCSAGGPPWPSWPWFRCPSTAGGTGSVPGWGTEIAHTMGRGKKKKKRLVLLTSTFIFVLLTFTRVKVQCDSCLGTTLHTGTPPPLTGTHGWRGAPIGEDRVCLLSHRVPKARAAV